MEIIKIEHFETIIDDAQIRKLLESIMFNPTYGKVQNIAQTIYAKTQGRFFIAKDNDHVIGLMGFSKIDNHKLIIRHFAVMDPSKSMPIGKGLLEHAIEEERVALVIAEVDEANTAFYKGCGFKIKKLPYDDSRGQYVECILETKYK